MGLTLENIKIQILSILKLNIIDIKKDVIGGLTSSLIAVAYGLTFTNLIFSGHAKPWIGYGLESTFITMAILAGVMALRSSLPFVIAGPDGATSAVTAVLVAAFLARLDEIGEPDDLLAPVMILLALSTALTGLVSWLIGIFRLSNAIRFIPYPVIGGFLAATGFLMLNGAIKIVIDRYIENWLLSYPLDTNVIPKLGASLIIFIAILLGQRLWKSPYAMPTIIMLSVLIGNAALYISGMSLEHAQAAGWFVHPPRDVNLVTTWDWIDLVNFPWKLLPSISGDIIAMIFVTTVSSLLNTNGIELLAKKDADLKQELESIGLANILSALCGGYIGCASINRTNLNYCTGARGRLSGLVVAAISLSIIFFGTSFTSYIPKFVLGGLLLNLGAGLVNKWVVESKKMLAGLEYVVLLTVMIVILKWGFIAGVIIGILIGCATFAYGASRANAIKFCFDGSEYSSSLDRSSEEIAILAKHKRDIQGFILQSYLFFGSANFLYESIKKLISSNQECRFLIFDFKLVHGLDSSAIHSFRQIKRIADELSLTLVFVNLSKSQIEDFKQIITDKDLIIDNLDKALEICENDVVKHYLSSNMASSQISGWLECALGDKELADRLCSLCERREYKKNDLIALQGALADSMHFILSGRLAVIIKLDDGSSTRVRSLGHHTTVGEMGLLTGESRSATIKAEEDSIVYQLSKKEFDKMKVDDPLLCEALLTYIITVLSQRLRLASNTIAVLNR